MSLKKDKFSKLDRFYMNLAKNLSKQNEGITDENPSVGCVIVKNKQIISYGVTNETGRPHAETVAINRSKQSIKGSTVYVTLEPCSHYGKTHPCTKSLSRSKVNKVIYSIEDPDERTNNKAKSYFRSKNIKILSGLMSNEIKQIYNKYIYSKKTKLPYVIGKIACTKNYNIFYNNTKITNSYSQAVSHLLRFKNQAIVTSYKTINTDNPELTCRLNGLKKFSPIIIIIDRKLKVNLNKRLFKNKKNNRVIIFHNSDNLKKIIKIKKKGVKLFKMKNKVNENHFLKDILKKIYSINIYSLIVECGKVLTEEFLKKKLFNEFYLFKGSYNQGSSKNSILNIVKKLNKNFNKKMLDTYLKNDKIIKYY